MLFFVNYISCDKIFMNNGRKILLRSKLEVKNRNLTFQLFKVGFVAPTIDITNICIFSLFEFVTVTNIITMIKEAQQPISSYCHVFHHLVSSLRNSQVSAALAYTKPSNKT